MNDFEDIVEFFNEKFKIPSHTKNEQILDEMYLKTGGNARLFA